MFIPKLRLAKDKGVEGQKIMNIKIKKKRALCGLKPIDIVTYFPDECDFRLSDQRDLLFELCKPQVAARPQYNFGGNNYYP